MVQFLALLFAVALTVKLFWWIVDTGAPIVAVYGEFRTAPM